MKVFIFDITVFWELMACSLVDMNQYLRGTCRIPSGLKTKPSIGMNMGGRGRWLTGTGDLRGPIRRAEKNGGQNNGKLPFNSSRAVFKGFSFDLLQNSYRNNTSYHARLQF